MTVKAHYDQHLGNFYSWMLGDFQQVQTTQETYFREKKLIPSQSKVAIDLGAGNGIQTVSLAHLGYKVIAVDFNDQLLTELTKRVDAESLDVEILKDDIRKLKQWASYTPELILCCGDTITHLASQQEIEQWIKDAYATLGGGGKLLLSFRDYGTALTDIDRFIPVKQDENRILTCYLEYIEDKVRVTDILHQREGGQWVQKISAYDKVRVTAASVKTMIKGAGFELIEEDIISRMIYLIAQKPELV